MRDLYVKFTGGGGYLFNINWFKFTLPVPEAPTGLAAAAVSTSQINLNWDASPVATSYTLKRSTTNGGPYAVVAAGITSTNYTDANLSYHKTYYYVLSGVNFSGESANSVQISIAPLSPPELQIIRTAGNLTFSWPGVSTGFTLQSCTNLIMDEWVDIGTPVPQIVGTNWQVSLPVTTTTPSIFYRLRNVSP